MLGYGMTGFWGFPGLGWAGLRYGAGDLGEAWMIWIFLSVLIFIGCFFAEYDDGWRGR